MNHLPHAILQRVAVLCISSITIIAACACSTETCGPEGSEILIEFSDGNFYIDQFENSRVNATGETAGTGTPAACNYPNTIPWGNITYEDARIACNDAGKRLCTKDEWMAACGKTDYPYGDTFKAARCNDETNGDFVKVIQTGAKPQCATTQNVFDMSGNLREWVEGGTLMGGAYSDADTDVSCSSAKIINDFLSYTPTQGDGFRCCRDASILP